MPKVEVFHTKMHEKVTLNVDIDLHTCLECANILLRVVDYKRLDEAIEETLAMES